MAPPLLALAAAINKPLLISKFKFISTVIAKSFPYLQNRLHPTFRQGLLFLGTSLFLASLALSVEHENGRYRLMAYPKDVELEMAHEQYKNFIAPFRPYLLAKDHELVVYLNSVVREITGDEGFEVDVLLTGDANALSFPNKRIILNSGLFNFCDDTEEIVCVIAHELAHIKMRHATEAHSIKDFLAVPIGLMFHSFLLAGLFPGHWLLSKLESHSSMHNNFKHETEADIYGLYLTIKTLGFDKNKTVSFWNRFLRAHITQTSSSSHPPVFERLRKMQEYVDTLGDSEGCPVEFRWRKKNDPIRVWVKRYRQV